MEIGGMREREQYDMYCESSLIRYDCVSSSLIGYDCESWALIGYDGF